jgi:hypothetical protein
MWHTLYMLGIEYKCLGGAVKRKMKCQNLEIGQEYGSNSDSHYNG